jgi:hypothetical protein
VGGSKAKWAGGERWKTAKRAKRVITRSGKWAAMVPLLLLIGCANPISIDQCQVYVDLAKGISLQLADQIDPESDEGKAKRKTYADMAELVADAGCAVTIPLLEDDDPEPE